MSLGSALRRLAVGVLHLAALALLVGLVVVLLGPGGPVDLGGLADDGDRPSTDGSTPTADGGGVSTATATGRPSGESPWGTSVVTVAVGNPAAPGRNVTGPVAEALDYWDANAGYADYPVEFRLRPDAEDADVVVWYNETIECANHDDAIGCAPLLESGTRADPPVRVQIRYDPTHNRRQVRNTAIHEFGHVLGITHCEEPYWVMASSCTEPIPDAPNADERDFAWRETTIAVHVDESNVSADDLDATRDQVGHALTYLGDGSAEGFPAVTFVRVDDRYDADVTIAFREELPCGGDSVVCTSHGGRDYDGDGALEYHSVGTVLIDANSDVDARVWYAGWGLSTVLAPGNVPPVFEDASYRERRGEWWE